MRHICEDYLFNFPEHSGYTISDRGVRSTLGAALEEAASGLAEAISDEIKSCVVRSTV